MKLREMLDANEDKKHTPKVKWKVASAPTGRYRSFERRGWPGADYEGDIPAASISMVLSH